MKLTADCLLPFFKSNSSWKYFVLNPCRRPKDVVQWFSPKSSSRAHSSAFPEATRACAAQPIWRVLFMSQRDPARPAPTCLGQAGHRAGSCRHYRTISLSG
jgi:hypothetical protein